MAVPKVILIGGAPMTGKSTVARILAGQLGHACLSTDDIGQAIEAVTTPASHPALHLMAGQDYREYYVTRSVDRLIAEADERHRALWPALERVICAHADWGGPLILEGWALQPDNVARLRPAGVASVWLVAEDGLLERRLRQEASFWRGASDEQAMIRHFLARSLACDARSREVGARLGLPLVPVAAEATPAGLADRCRRCVEA